MTLPLPAAEGSALSLPLTANHPPLHNRPFLSEGFFWPRSRGIASVTFDLGSYHRELFSALDIPCPPVIHRSAVKRQAEYLASRWLVREVFNRVQIKDFILGNAADRSPLWPSGYSGSLSHSPQQAFLVIDPEGRLCGNDVEPLIPPTVAAEISPLLLTPREQRLLAELPCDPHQTVTLIFTLKESLYKALWPRVRCRLDFLQAEVVMVDLFQGCATLQLTESLDPHWQEGTPFCFCFTLRDKVIFSWSDAESC